VRHCILPPRCLPPPAATLTALLTAAPPALLVTFTPCYAHPRTATYCNTANAAAFCLAACCLATPNVSPRYRLTTLAPRHTRLSCKRCISLQRSWRQRCAVGLRVRRAHLRQRHSGPTSRLALWLLHSSTSTLRWHRRMLSTTGDKQSTKSGTRALFHSAIFVQWVTGAAW